jgi:hypothetical protein
LPTGYSRDTADPEAVTCDGCMETPEFRAYEGGWEQGRKAAARSLATLVNKGLAKAREPE